LSNPLCEYERKTKMNMQNEKREAETLEAAHHRGTEARRKQVSSRPQKGPRPAGRAERIQLRQGFRFRSTCGEQDGGQEAEEMAALCRAAVTEMGHRNNTLTSPKFWSAGIYSAGIGNAATQNNHLPQFSARLRMPEGMGTFDTYESAAVAPHLFRIHHNCGLDHRAEVEKYASIVVTERLSLPQRC
jgi:hypothetical protein